MISITTEAPEVEEKVRENKTAPVSVEQVEKDVHKNDTAPFSTPPLSSDNKIKEMIQEQKKEVTSQQI